METVCFEFGNDEITWNAGKNHRNKSFIRPSSDAGDITHGKTNIQYKASFAITGVFQGTFCECFYQELGLVSLEVGI